MEEEIECGKIPHPDIIISKWKNKDNVIEEYFNKELALAALLMEEHIFLNTCWMNKDWPEEAKKQIKVCVNCSDIFAWGTADAEPLLLSELRDIYEHYVKDNKWGTAIWCIKKRRELPQAPVLKKIEEEGIWDLETLKKEHDLRNNYYDGISSVLSLRKYHIYVNWAKKQHKEIVSYIGGLWWKLWNEYIQENPDWNNEEWKNKDKEIINKWKQENGYQNE